MGKTPSVLGVITARGGSKGIPRKNITELCGKPLIAYTIDAAKKSKLLTAVIVSTDDEEIAGVAKSLGADVPFLRPKKLADDASRSVDVMAHALEWMKENRNMDFEYAMILQPTSPLRKAEDIDACIKIAGEQNADSVMSMVHIPDFAVEKLKSIDGSLIKPLLKTEGKDSAHRTEGEKAYKRNTAIYLTRSDLLKKGEMFGRTSYAYVMPAERSIDINEQVDVDLSEFFLKKLGHAS